jgi:hypothetical protein
MKAKLTYTFKLVKNQEKSGAWLATAEVVGDSDAYPDNFPLVSAWTSVAPAKRWCAQLIGRKSIRWVADEENKSFTAEVEVKV